METTSALAYWPIVHTLLLIAIGITSWGWKSVSKKLDGMSVQLIDVSAKQSVANANFTNHEQLDRESLHQIRSDMQERLSMVHKRLDAHRESIESLHRIRALPVLPES